MQYHGIVQVDPNGPPATSLDMDRCVVEQGLLHGTLPAFSLTAIAESKPSARTTRIVRKPLRLSILFPSILPSTSIGSTQSTTSLSSWLD